MQQKNGLLDDKVFRPVASVQLLDHSVEFSESITNYLSNWITYSNYTTDL